LLVDGNPLVPKRLQAWRKQIGYVSQDTFLFHETVRANLLWAQPDATVEEIWEALRLASADDCVTALPLGLDTVVGDRGVLLSGGERQRLAMARALLRKPTLLILDEATSNLDPENEHRILRAIDQLRGSMTIVIISHRLSAVRGADVIHMLENGRLTESETYSALMVKENGKFHALYQPDR
jgi:ATP-binding cassette subfamily C protein